MNWEERGKNTVYVDFTSLILMEEEDYEGRGGSDRVIFL